MRSVPETYWRPQILRHKRNDGSEEYAVHEAFYGDYGKTWGPTESAVSNRFASVQTLRASLEQFLESGVESMICGDRGYRYYCEDVELWMRHIEDPVLDFPVD